MMFLILWKETLKKSRKSKRIEDVRVATNSGANYAFPLDLHVGYLMRYLQTKIQKTKYLSFHLPCS